MELGKLEKVKDLRSIWGREDTHFTSWLAEEDNLAILADEIGIEMELKGTEVPIGDFNADIVASQGDTDNIIVIENQLEKTNHDHLGKIITYASGLSAKIIIWIVKGVRDEHRQAIDWLNEHTDDNINIFLCKIELWKINDSPVAPKFQIVSSPNNWTKTMKNSVDNNNFTQNQMLRYEYWKIMSERIDDDYPFNSRSPTKYYWYSLSIGTTLAHISLTMSTQKNEVKTKLIVKKQEVYDYLIKFKNEIESEIELELIWESEIDKKHSFIYLTKKCDINNKENWDEAINWQLEIASKFYDAFSDRIKNFKY